jgi:DNA-binding IclR family transcriptional regulator
VLSAWGEKPGRLRVLQDELAAIRKTGFAVSTGEVDSGVWGVSAPLFGANRQALAALTLMAPTMRAKGQEAALTNMAMVTAARISRVLSPP